MCIPVPLVILIHLRYQNSPGALVKCWDLWAPTQTYRIQSGLCLSERARTQYPRMVLYSAAFCPHHCSFISNDFHSKEKVLIH